VANLFILLPLVNPGFISLIPYGASLASKVLFGRLPLLQFFWQPRSLSAARTSGTSKAEVRFHGPSIDSQELPEPVDPQSVRQRQPPPEVLAAMEIAALQELSCASHSSGMRDRDRSQLKRGDIHKEKGLHSSMPAATLLLTGPRGPMHTRTGSTRLNCRPDRRNPAARR
jgi:hypothetical protein